MNLTAAAALVAADRRENGYWDEAATDAEILAAVRTGVDPRTLEGNDELTNAYRVILGVNVPASRLPKLATVDLIAQYDLAAYGARRGQMPNWKMRRARIARITDLLLVRAEDGDTEADRWFQEA